MFDFKLSDEQKRRIEQEERVRLAEEQFRASVREKLVTAPEEPRPSGSGFFRRVLILGSLLLIGYLFLK